jgi:hypothetical protein
VRPALIAPTDTAGRIMYIVLCTASMRLTPVRLPRDLLMSYSYQRSSSFDRLTRKGTEIFKLGAVSSPPTRILQSIHATTNTNTNTNTLPLLQSLSSRASPHHITSCLLTAPPQDLGLLLSYTHTPAATIRKDSARRPTAIMCVKEHQPLVNHCCTYCCKAVDFGTHDYCSSSYTCPRCP